jgi:hypothetical protein
LVDAIIYVEGGGDSKELRVRCREGFRKLLIKAGFDRRMPRLVACGGRNATFDSFETALLGSHDYVGMLVDSEDPRGGGDEWEHLRLRDKWVKPAGATNEQVLLMTTCMETWIVADHGALERHYGAHLRKNSLPALQSLEERDRHDVQEALIAATKDCTNCYRKGVRSFEALAQLDPDTLRQHLPSFKRVCEVLTEVL